MQQDEPCPQESHSTQAEMESYKEQMKEMQKRIGSLFQSEQHIRDRLQKVATEAEKIRQTCLSNKKGIHSHTSKGKENSERCIVDAEHTKEIISKLLGEMNKLRAYWMQEMQLRHCCQNEVFEYKHMVAGMDASSNRVLEELEYYRAQSTRYKQALLSTTNGCIKSMNEAAEKTQNLIQGSNKLNLFKATVDRIQNKVKFLCAKKQEQQLEEEKLQKVLVNNDQLNKKLEAIRNEMQFLNTALTYPNQDSQRHEELKQMIQEMKQEIQGSAMTLLDTESCMQQQNFQLLVDLKKIGVELQNIGRMFEMERRNAETIHEQKTILYPNCRMSNVHFTKCTTHTESLPPSCYRSLSIDKLPQTQLVSIPPQPNSSLCHDSEANDQQRNINSSTWKVFKVQSNRRVGAIHTSSQADQDSIQTSHNEKINKLSVEVRNVESPKHSNTSQKACNKTTKGSKRQAPKREPYRKGHGTISHTNKVKAPLKRGNGFGAVKEQGLEGSGKVGTYMNVLQQENKSTDLTMNHRRERETKQDSKVREQDSEQQQVQVMEQGKSLRSDDNLRTSTAGKEGLTVSQLAPSQKVAPSSKCFGRKRKSTIVDEYEFTAETCCQTLPLSFFQNLQI